MKKTSNTAPKLAFIASAAAEAQAARKKLAAMYGETSFEEADVVVALGGDGIMLQTLHRCLRKPKPIYGMNRGSVGFLMNEFSDNDLLDRIQSADHSTINPLLMKATATDGTTLKARAINEVSLYRQSYQAAKIAISIDGQMRMPELVCDGVLVATPAGSTAYNFSAHGPIIPLGASLLALTPISPFRPRRWRGALLKDRASIILQVLEPEKRPVAAVADHTEVRHVSEVEVKLDHSITLTMLHDAGRSLDERILNEQFGD